MAERRLPLHGEIDLSNSSEFEAKLLTLVNVTDDDIVVDCGGLTFIDSTSVPVIVRIQQLLDIQYRQLRIVNLTGIPRRALDALGLAAVLDIEESATP